MINPTFELPEGGLEFEPPLCVFGLSGGLSCLSASNGLCWLLLPDGYMRLWTDLTDSRLPVAISKLGRLRPLTKSYFREAEALQETVGATNFSILDNDANSEDRRQFERWSGLSVALENLEERNSSARAMRIGNQILFCSRNIGWLEKIYRETIIKKFSSDSISRPEEECFSYSEDAYSSEIGYRTQSCLDSLFALRDFLFSFVFHDMYKGEKYAWNKLEKCLREDDRFNLAGEILHRTEQGSQPGSIALMSLYRNVLFHYLGPRYGIARPMYTFNIESTEFGDIPFLISPLYDDFEALKLVERGQVSLGWLDREGEFERFLRCKSHIDALEFCFDSYSELLKVGRAIERVIDIKSEIRKITEKEILSGEFRDELGNLTRYRRNDSGQLEQF